MLVHESRRYMAWQRACERRLNVFAADGRERWVERLRWVGLCLTPPDLPRTLLSIQHRAEFGPSMVIGPRFHIDIREADPVYGHRAVGSKTGPSNRCPDLRPVSGPRSACRLQNALP
jgi:hypothetical protein